MNTDVCYSCTCSNVNCSSGTIKCLFCFFVQILQLLKSQKSLKKEPFVEKVLSSESRKGQWGGSLREYEVGGVCEEGGGSGSF